MHLGALDPLRMDFGRTRLAGIDTARIFLGKGEDDSGSRQMLRMQQSIAMREEQERTERRRKEEEIAKLVFCPTGQRVNPDFEKIPIEARAAAQAAGIKQCVEDPLTAAIKGAKGHDAKCYFAVGKKKFKCTQAGADKAIAFARSRATRGRPSLVLHVAGNQIRLSKLIVPIRRGAFPSGAMFPPGAMPAGAIPAQSAVASPAGALSIAPATVQGDRFSCPEGYSVAYSASGTVTCVQRIASEVMAPGPPQRRRPQPDRDRRRRRSRRR